MTLHLPAETAERVRALAQANETTEDAVLIELIEFGLESRHYSELLDRLAASSDPTERAALKEELAQLTFGR